MEKMVAFMQHIVEQPLNTAQRYNREFWGQRYLEREKKLVIQGEKTWKDLLKEKVLSKLH
jgi:hypothetical protein